MSMHREHHEAYDVVVIGAGIAGETCARRTRGGGLRVALIDHASVGGEAATWSPIPSMSLLGPANARWQRQMTAEVASPAVAWPRTTAYLSDQTQQESDTQRVARLEREGIDFLRGDGHIVGPGHVAVYGVHGEPDRLLQTRCLVIAAGSIDRPPGPEIAGLAETGYWTTRDVSTATAQPISLIVLDLAGGARAVELAQMFRHYGSEVTLITVADRLVSHEDREVGEILARHLQHSGIRLLLERRAVLAERGEGGIRRVTLDDGAQVRGETVLVVGSRLSSTEGLGLEHIGIRVDESGILVDEFCRAGEGVWAIGGVTGVAPRIHTALYQARIAADDILGHGHPAHYGSVPRIAYTDPLVAATGLTMAEAQAQHIDIASASLELTELILHTGTAGAPVGGKFTLHADRTRGVLIGAWAVAPDAGEWIHLAVLAIRAGVALEVVRDTVEQFPPFSEGYLQALDHLI